MIDDLSILPQPVRDAMLVMDDWLTPEVAADLDTLSEHWPECERRIRAELLRVTAELAHEEQRVLSAMDALHEGDKELTRVKAELAKLRARIAGVG